MRCQATRERGGMAVTSGPPLLDAGRRDRVEDRADDRLGRDALGLALEIQDDAVPERGEGNRADVVDGDVEATVEESVDLAGGHEGLRAAWRAAVTNIVADDLGCASLVGVRGGEDADRVGRDV